MQSYPEIIHKTPKEINCEIDELIKNIRKSSTTGIHIGCGNTIIPELINCDRFNIAADINLDAINLSIFPDSSVDLIENHHIIEHLSFEQANIALREWSRVLKPAGYLITTCPDIDRITLLWSQYKGSANDTEFSDYILKMIFGSQENEGMFHKSGYNISILSKMLIDFGFTVDFSFSPYPDRTTPSLIVIARKKEGNLFKNDSYNNQTVYTNEYFINKRMSGYITSYKKFKDRIVQKVDEQKQDGSIAVYGSGDLCEIIISALKDFDIRAIVDSNTQKCSTSFCGLPVIPLAEIGSYDIKNIIIASVAHKRDIYEILSRELKENNITIIPPNF
ncbi:MAG: methyltransferase domain-containing protein [Candidatus Auribacterota bacterium]|jgi:predicted SAM-dependent methyltransferase|nr:methyltransferase domain-containing protein [Candidatus Auribacterota bacterium]